MDTPPACQIFIPLTRQEKRKARYMAAGVTTNAMVVALWEKVVEGRPEAADALQAKRTAIKANIP